MNSSSADWSRFGFLLRHRKLCSGCWVWQTRFAIVESWGIILALPLEELDCKTQRYCLIVVLPLAGHIFDLVRHNNKNMEDFL